MATDPSNSQQTELALYEAWRSRRELGALERLLALKLPFVYRVACRITADAHDAEDVTQQVLLALCSAPPRVIRALDPFLYVATVRAARDFSRSERRRKTRESQERDMASSEIDPALQAAGREEHAALHAALGELPAPLREAVVLEYMEQVPRKVMCEALAISESTLRERLERALEQLERLLRRRGVVIAGGALAAALGTLPAPLASAVFIARASSGATLVATSAGVFGKALLAAAVVCAIAAIPITRHFMTTPSTGGPVGKPQARPDEQPATHAALWVTPRGPVVTEAFEQLRSQGLKVASLFSTQQLKIPTALRFKRVDGRELLAGLAKARGAEVKYLHDGKLALFHLPLGDEKFGELKAELESTNALARWDGAWRAGWLRDERVVAMLVKAARDQDAEVAHQARRSLTRLGWEAVLAVDEDALELAAEATHSQEREARHSALMGLGRLGGDKAFAVLESALAAPGTDSRNIAVLSLAAAGGERAMKGLEPLLGAQDDLQFYAYNAMGYIGSTRALRFLEDGLNDARAESRARNGAAAALMQIRGPDAVALLKKAVSNPDPNVRMSAALGLTFNGDDAGIEHMEKALAAEAPDFQGHHAVFLGHAGERALGVIEKLLASKDAAMRRNAAASLGYVGSARDLELLDRALSDSDPLVRNTAAYSLSRLDFDAAWPRLQHTIKDADETVRASTLGALQEFDDERAKALSRHAFADPSESVRAAALSFRLGGMYLESVGLTVADLAHVRAIADAALKSADANALATLATGMRAADGPLAIEYLDKLLDQADRDVCMAAVDSLGEIGGRKAHELLEKALRNSISLVRAQACTALGKLGGPRALMRLDQLLGDPQIAVLQNAAKALAASGGEQLLPRLETTLNGPDAQRRIGAAYALGFVGGPRATELLGAALSHTDMLVRGASSDALGNIGDERAVTLLERIVTDKDHNLRFNLAHLLGHLGPKRLVHGSEYEPDAATRARALTLLERLLLSDEASAVRKQAASALRELPGDRAKGILLAALRTEKVGSAQERILFALRSYKDDPAVAEAVKNKPAIEKAAPSAPPKKIPDTF